MIATQLMNMRVLEALGLKDRVHVVRSITIRIEGGKPPQVTIEEWVDAKAEDKLLAALTEWEMNPK